MRILPYIRAHFTFDTIIRDLHVSGQSELPPAKHINPLKLLLLKAVPYICLGLFGLSFYWDFEQLSISGLPLQGVLRLVSVAGLIGFFTNWLAIKMLFHPRQKRPILGQGLLPSQQQRIAARVAEGIHKNLLNEQELIKVLKEEQVVEKVLDTVSAGLRGLSKDDAFQEEVTAVFVKTLESYLSKEEVQEKLAVQLDTQIRSAVEGKMLPSLYLRMNRKKYEKSLKSFITDLPAQAGSWIGNPGELLEGLADELEEKKEVMEQDISHMVQTALEGVRVRDLLYRQLAGFDSAKLEGMIWGSTNEQLKYIQYLGGWLGMIGGLVLWQPLYVLAGLAVLVGLMFLLDSILFKPKGT